MLVLWSTIAAVATAPALSRVMVMTLRKMNARKNPTTKLSPKRKSAGELSSINHDSGFGVPELSIVRPAVSVFEGCGVGLGAVASA